ncbi:hypothetical protein GCM10023093_12020 [Nemorincola caseinilytica]|uniref:Carboxypeptidase regulatory-like domain-containing protein n=1 Tax=Nemorincola caseinilytica TaxID=2054315 RepID=A0ABP8NCC7_9BACT
MAGAQDSGEEEIPDEISVSLEVKGVGAGDIPALYLGKDVYLSVTGIFDLIKIRNFVYPSQDSIKGFYIQERDTFLIDKPGGRVYFKGVVHDVADHGLLRNETGLYLNLKHFKTIFGLDGIFYFRRLVVTMVSDVELPAIREARQDLMRKNVSRLRGDIKADTNIKRTYPFFHFGMADWAVMSSQQSQGGDQTTVNLSMGGVLAGGELNTSLNYYSQQEFTEKLQFYQWRYVNNESPVLRQVAAGKIFTQSTSTLYAPVVGVQVSNVSTLYKRAYGTYLMSNTTEPNWMVELYVNDVLVDYTKADASGFYSFDVPLIYGYTTVRLKFYGPYGEVRSSQQYINIPFNFVPAGEVEYSVNGGIVEDGKDSKFSRAYVKYGLSRHVTVGGGNEYLSSVTSGSMMPFMNSSVRLAPRLLVSAEYAHSARSRAILSYRMPKGMQCELDYTKFAKGQTAIFFNFLEERKAIVSMPLRAKRVSAFARLTLDQIILPNTQYTNSELSLTGFVGKVGLNFSSFTSFMRDGNPYFYSVASATIPLPARILFTSQIQYDHKTNVPVFAKLTFEKNVKGKGYISGSYQEYFNISNRNFLLGMRYDLSFAKAAVSVLSGSDGSYSRIQAASGSIVVDRKSGYLKAGNRTNVSKGGVAIEAFLDVNANGLRDAGEPRVPGLKVQINGGRTIYDEKDTMIRILDLEPYNSYFIELIRSSFDNISWQLQKKTLNVTVNPNNFTLIQVPVVVVGEVSGMVSKATSDVKSDARGLGQVIVAIYNNKNELVARTVSESDGYFNYLGLKAGLYTVRVDPGQLAKLHLRSTPEFVPIVIKEGTDGDVADGVEFVLTPDGK